MDDNPIPLHAITSTTDASGSLRYFVSKGHRVSFGRRMFKGEKKPIPVQLIYKCGHFAYQQAINERQRPYRSGGAHVRQPWEVFRDTITSKPAEYLVRRYFKSKGYSCSEVDDEMYERGRWDEYDLRVSDTNREYEVQVKKCPSYGNLLLLEREDSLIHSRYDFIVLVRSECRELEQYLGKYKSLASEKEVMEMVASFRWYFDIAGFCSKVDYNKVVKLGHIIFKCNGDGTRNYLGGGYVDADNYYILASDLRVLPMSKNVIMQSLTYSHD